jgi:hypothetical protein
MLANVHNMGAESPANEPVVVATVNDPGGRYANSTGPKR